MGWRRLEKLFEKHANELYATAWSVTGERASAEDAVHEALISVAEGSTRPLRLKAYLFRAVYHAALKQKRQAGRFELELDSEPVDPGTEPLDAVMAARLGDTIAALPEDKRQVLILKLYAGMTFREIAGITGESINTVSSRYRRALSELQEQYDHE